MELDLLICVDAKKVVDNWKTKTTSPSNPGPCDHHWAFMITNVENVVKENDKPSTNGTADLKISAGAGDVIRITSTSVSNELDYAVYVYDFQHWKGDNVLDNAGMKNRTITGLATVPSPDQADHQPPSVTFERQPFYVEQIDVNGPGTEYFYVCFVVYGKPSSGNPNERPVLGYYRWDPSITAK